MHIKHMVCDRKDTKKVLKTLIFHKKKTFFRVF